MHTHLQTLWKSRWPPKVLVTSRWRMVTSRWRMVTLPCLLACLVWHMDALDLSHRPLGKWECTGEGLKLGGASPPQRWPWGQAIFAVGSAGCSAPSLASVYSPLLASPFPSPPTPSPQPPIRMITCVPSLARRLTCSREGDTILRGHSRVSTARGYPFSSFITFESLDKATWPHQVVFLETWREFRVDQNPGSPLETKA